MGAKTVKTADREPPAALGEGAWRGLFLLTLVFAINSLDRSAMIVVIEPIKHEFNLKDSQLGLLTGLAFGASYAIFAIPLGALADRVNRRNLLAALLATWSLATVACGFARDFVTLVAARMVVGAAESGGSPTSNSMLSDMFPPNRRATAVGIFFLGPPIGAALSFLVGSAVAATYGWRTTFLLAGLPGVILAVVLLFIMRHPARGGTDAAGTADTPGSVRGGLRSLFTNPMLVCIFFAFTFSTAVITSFQAWFPSLLMREHGMTLKEAGAAMSLGGGLFSALGVAFSGRIADAVAKGEAGGLLLFTAAALFLTLVCAVVAAATPNTTIAVVAFCGFGLFHLAHLGSCFAVLLNATPNRHRGVVVGTLQVSANFIGAGVGPWLTGALSDRYSGPHALSQAVLTVLPLQLVAAALCIVAWRVVRADRVAQTR